MVDRLLSLTEVFGADLAADPAFRALVVEHYDRLTTDGVQAAVKAALRNLS